MPGGMTPGWVVMMREPEGMPRRTGPHKTRTQDRRETTGEWVETMPVAEMMVVAGTTAEAEIPEEIRAAGSRDA